MGLTHILTKLNYIFKTTKVSSSNLNDIQDAVIELQEKHAAVGFHDIMVVTLPGITSLPKTFAVTGMTADHELIQKDFASVRPSSSMSGEWTLTPGAGTVTVTGTMSGSTSTTIVATMGIPDNKVTGVAQ